MKAKVLNAFYDSVAKIIRNKGDIITISPARFCEINTNGKFLEAYAEPQNAENEDMK